MRRTALVLWVAAFSFLFCSAARASDPPVVGKIQGLELAQQTDSHPAIFVGIFQGKVNGKTALGTWAVGVNHETPLPDESEESIAVTGGQWGLDVLVLQGFRLRQIRLRGGITGSVTFLQTDQFSVQGVMTLSSGGSGDILLNLLLDHTVFPPAVSGTLSQP